jgi:parallel beta-helix repeat protein
LDNDDFSNAGQMYLVNCNNSIISNLDLSDGTVSMSLTNCSDIEISYNNLSSNNWWGIDLFNCVNLSIIENDINGNSIGIKGGLTNSIILGNEVNFNLEEGIYMSLSNNNSISKNNINSNGFRAGIRMFGYCSDNLISNNRFKNNFWEGLSLALYSSNNTITGNVFKSNRIGVGFDFSCSNNAFYLNFFINSEESHVSGPHITNTWNTTDIGNYWDNYTGSDNDGDGIGDIPHIISLSPLIIDYLPIVDNDPPIITIIKPINNSKIGSLAPSFNIRVEEKYLDVMWYTLDGGLNNYTFIENGTINQGAWDALNYGQITIRFYAVDKVGYISFMDVVVVKKLPETELIPGYNLFVLFCVISIIGVILVSIRRKSYSLLKKI